MVSHLTYYLRIILAVVLVFPAVLIGQERIQDVRSDIGSLAGKKYRDAQFADATRLYDSLLASGVDDARIWYNAANAYFKRGMIAHSRLYLERARRLDPGDPDILHNLNIITSRLTDTVEPIPQLFIITWWNLLKWNNTPASLFTWSGIIFFLLCLSVAAYYWIVTVLLRRMIFFCGIGMIILWLASIFLFLDGYEDYTERRAAIVMKGVVTVKSSPDRSGVDIFSIHEGLKVEILDTFDNWHKVRLPDGKMGWILASDAVRI